MTKAVKSYRIEEETVAAIEAEAERSGQSAASVVNALLSEALSRRQGPAEEAVGHEEGVREKGAATAPDSALVKALETNASDLRATVAVLREQLAAKDEQIAAAHAIAAREQERAALLLEAAADRSQAEADKEDVTEEPEDHRDEEPRGRLRRAVLALRGRL